MLPGRGKRERWSPSQTSLPQALTSKGERIHPRWVSFFNSPLPPGEGRHSKHALSTTPLWPNRSRSTCRFSWTRLSTGFRPRREAFWLTAPWGAAATLGPWPNR